MATRVDVFELMNRPGPEEVERVRTLVQWQGEAPRAPDLIRHEGETYYIARVVWSVEKRHIQRCSLCGMLRIGNDPACGFAPSHDWHMTESTSTPVATVYVRHGSPRVT